jgi:hypothetical protein
MKILKTKPNESKLKVVLGRLSHLPNSLGWGGNKSEFRRDFERR